MVAFAVDMHGGKPAGEPVVAALGEGHARPVLPLGGGTRDPQRQRFGFQDGGSDPLVDAHPGVKQPAVGTPPARVPLDRHKRVAFLPARPDRRDQRLQAVAAGDIAHRAHGGHAHPPALDVPRNHNHERAEHVGVGLVETTSDRAVDPGRQVLQRAVPAERDGAGQGEDLIIVRPIRKSSMRRDIRRVITPYLEPGESIEICAVLYGAALAYGWGLIGGIRAITRNRTVPVYYAAVTGRRVLMVELSWYTLRPRGLALSDARQGPARK